MKIFLIKDTCLCVEKLYIKLNGFTWSHKFKE